MKFFSNNNKIQPLSHWTTYAKNKKKLIVFYGQDVLDLTDFARKHPAGQKAISCYLLQDVKNILFRVYPHPNSTVDTLKKYICGKVKDHREVPDQQHKGICKDKSSLTNKKQQPGKKVTFDVSKEPEKKSTQRVKSTSGRTKDRQFSLKMEETVNFQENKPTLLVPHFNVRIFCFSKQQQKQNIDKHQDI